MKHFLLSGLLVIVLTGCKTGGHQADPGSLTLDDVAKISIATSKGRAAADAQAEQGCQRAQKKAVYQGSEPNADNTAVVYTYSCS